MLKNLFRTLRTARYLKPAQLWARIDYKTRLHYYNSPLYPYFSDIDPDKLDQRIILPPPHLWAGDAKVGKNIAENKFTFVGRTINMGQSDQSTIDWLPHEASALWQYHLNYFDWLADLRAMKNAGLHHARRFIEDWIDTFPHFHPVTWHPYPLSLRIISWLTHGPWLLKDIAAYEQEAFFTSLHLQANHLQNVLEWDVGGNHLIKNLKALIYIGLCLPDQKNTAAEALDILLKQLKIQILPDGCHYERSPHYHIDVLQDLLDIQALLLKSAHPCPPQLENAIDRMATVTSFFRHGDGGLALFNDGTVGHEKVLHTIRSRCGKTEVIPKDLPNAGYVRLGAEDTNLIMDTGLCCPDELPAHAHADMLSFELSIGKDRIFVNSGTFAYQHASRNDYRGTAAHNTVCINREDSAEVYGNFRLGRRPRNVTYNLKIDKKVGSGVTASHDGYKHLGFSHNRQIFLSADGTDLRGEDHITHKRKLKKRQFPRAHFHLHPDINCHMKSNTEAELTTKSGLKLTFKVGGGRIHEMEYLYSPHFGHQQKSRDLVLTGNWADGQSVMKWSLKRS